MIQQVLILKLFLWARKLKLSGLSGNGTQGRVVQSRLEQNLAYYFFFVDNLTGCCKKN